MRHTSGNYAAFCKPRRPQGIEERKAWIVGGGLAGLSAAAFLVRDAQMPGGNITVLEALPLMGGGCDGIRDPRLGYVVRGGREMEDHFECLWDLFRSIPSLETTGLSVLDEFYYLNLDDPSSSPVRVTEKRGQDAGTLHKFGLTDKAALELAALVATPEEDLDGVRIREVLGQEFFQSNFWLFWRTMFAFEDWHSAAEMRRYLTRFIHHTPAITDLSCLKFTAYNQYESLILPLERFLEDSGVHLRRGCVATDVRFAFEGRRKRAATILLRTDAGVESIAVRPQDLVFTTLGSNTEQSALGSQTLPAEPPEGLGASWELWRSIAAQSPDFGRPERFCGDRSESNWESATITCLDDRIPSHIRRLTGRDTAGGKVVTGGPITARDSSWLLSWTVSRQPHFKEQKPTETVAWVYGLFSDTLGDYVRKPMRSCSGEEICMEWLFHIGVPQDEIQELARSHATTIPCMMPYVTSYFMVRSRGDRPLVVPEGAENFAFIGEHVETPDDTVFTTEYAVRTAMEAVYTLLDIERGVPEVFASQYDLRTLARTAGCLLEGRKLCSLALPMPERLALKQALKRLEGTTVHKMLEEAGLV